MRARIKHLERFYHGVLNNNGVEFTPEVLAELAVLIISWVIEDACLEALGVPEEERSPLPPDPEDLRADPVIKAEIERRLPVLRAWRRWYEAYCGKELPLEYWADWDWAVSAVNVLRRDGTRGQPKAEELLKVANLAQVGSYEQETAWVQRIVQAIKV